MSAPVTLGIDLGTQSVRVMAVSADGVVRASSRQPLASTRDGARHEQSPELWWKAVAACCRSVASTLRGGTEIEGVAVDATSGTILLVDDQLRPLTPGLMYDDGRASEEAAEVQQAGASLWSELSYRMQPSWGLPKLLWLTRHTPTETGARLLHQSDFINARLAGRRLAADSSNALKTGYDSLRQQWPTAVHEALQLRSDLFPEVVLPGTLLSEVGDAAAGETGVPAGTPIFAGMTDGCAAQISSGATAAGSWNSVIGTTMVLKGVTRELLRDPLGVVYSHRSADGFWLPGGAASTGAGLLSAGFAEADLPALNRAAMEMPPTLLLVYPLLGRGERFPFAAPEAQGFELGEATSTGQRFRGILEGIAFAERLAFDALRAIGAPTGGCLTISGGATRSEALNQIRADVLERELILPLQAEGAFGMAMLAAAHGSSIAEVTARMVRVDRAIAPSLGLAAYREQYVRFVQELLLRGWLGRDLADAAVRGASA